MSRLSHLSNNFVVVCCDKLLCKILKVQTVMDVTDVWFREAFHFVQRKRFCINPNEGFTRQLMVCALTIFILVLCIRNCVH